MPHVPPRCRPGPPREATDIPGTGVSALQEAAGEFDAPAFLGYPPWGAGHAEQAAASDPHGYRPTPGAHPPDPARPLQRPRHGHPVQLAEALRGPRRPLPLLLEGEGDVFSVGGDIADSRLRSPGEAIAYSRLGQVVVGLIEPWPAVTVARISGYALGTGLELALGCDVLVGTSDVRLGLPGLAWALVPCLGGLRRLSCRLTSELCSDLFLGGEVLEAPKCARGRACSTA